jgi:hypothetical protein
MRWTMRPLPYAPASADPDRGAIPSTDGVFIGPLGALVGPLDISLDGRAAGTLASGTSLPTLVRPAVPAPPSWNSSRAGGSFETSRNGALSWGAPGYGSLTAQDGVLLACYGGGTLTAIVTLDAAARDTVLSRKAVPCNGSVQVVREAQARSDKRSATLSFERSDRFQAVRFASGHPG